MYIDQNQEVALKDLQARLDDAEEAALKGGTKHVQKLELESERRQPKVCT